MKHFLLLVWVFLLAPFFCKADQYPAWSSDQALFLIAVERGDRYIAERYLKEGMSPNVIDNDGFTALHLAVKYESNLEIMRLLIEHGADLEARTPRSLYDTPLAMAFRSMEAAHDEYRHNERSSWRGLQYFFVAYGLDREPDKLPRLQGRSLDSKKWKLLNARESANAKKDALRMRALQAQKIDLLLDSGAWLPHVRLHSLVKSIDRGIISLSAVQSYFVHYAHPELFGYDDPLGNYSKSFIDDRYDFSDILRYLANSADCKVVLFFAVNPTVSFDTFKKILELAMERERKTSAKGFNINIVDKNGKTLLMYAVESLGIAHRPGDVLEASEVIIRQGRKVSLLLKHGAKVDMPTHYKIMQEAMTSIQLALPYMSPPEQKATQQICAELLNSI